MWMTIFFLLHFEQKKIKCKNVFLRKLEIIFSLPHMFADEIYITFSQSDNKK